MTETPDTLDAHAQFPIFTTKALMPRVPLVCGIGWQISPLWGKVVLSLGVIFALALTITAFVCPDLRAVPLAGQS